MTDYNENYQYNSCTSRGICSVDPRTSSLQEILILYLCLSAYYAEKLENAKLQNKKIKNLILNTISIIVSNPEFSENDFLAIIKGFNKELPTIIKEYENLCESQNTNPVHPQNTFIIDEHSDLLSSIRSGQKEYLKSLKTLPEHTRNIYKILFVLAKSICINILDLETFGIETDYSAILKILNSINNYKTNKELKKILIDTAKKDNKLMKQLAEEKNRRYGEQRPKDVSYTTKPGKAILVVGSNIRELEIILESLKDIDVSIYTHDEMLIAHTFPKFEEYKNLKGQFGQGSENCLLDFATFPGPIILTRHSLYNVEHFYRGRLFTTDFAYLKGVIPIINYDFSELIKTLEKTKGFKTGKTCLSETVGYNWEENRKKIDEKIQSGKYKQIVVFGLNNHSQEDIAYFKTFTRLAPKNILIISLSYKEETDNFIYLNACFDSYSMLKLAETILQYNNIKTTLIFPKCNKHTISEVIYLSSKNNVEIFIGKCTPITLNPNLITTMTKLFKIKKLTSPKKDLDLIIKNK